MKSTLAFAAGMLAGLLLAWAVGPAFTQLAHDWPASVRAEALLRVRSGLAFLRSGQALSPPEPPLFSTSLRRPVTRCVRMVSSGPILPAASTSNATVPAARADEPARAAVDAASNASSASLAGPAEMAVPAPRKPDAEPAARPQAEQIAEAGRGAAPAPRPVAGKKGAAGSPQEDYALALASYQSGRHAVSRERFAAFLAAYPGHALAPNALYWSGETWYAQGRYDRAATFFQQVVRDHPRHAKSPDALLKLAYSAMRQGRIEQAGKYLRQLEASYPDSPASRLGRQARSRLHGRNGFQQAVLTHG